VLLIALLPERYSYMPTSVSYVVAALMIVPMVLVIVTKGGATWKRIERIAELFAVGIALLANLANLLVVAYLLVENPGVLQPVPLFYTSVGIWTGNVLVFTLVYWLIDRGGPDARLNNKVKYPDFDFPAMDDADHVPPNWIYYINRVQSDRSHAAYPACQTANDFAKPDRADYDRDCGRADDQHFEMKRVFRGRA
jgi:hypothetical protein